MWKCVLFLCLVVALHCAKSDSKNEDGKIREVKTAQGVVRGRRDPISRTFIFYGIPYATVPVGANRYKEPLPGPAWLQPLDATVDKGIVCPQVYNPFLGEKTLTKTMQDDCLIANVYVPDTKEKKLPVAVYIHGGAFQIGYGNMVTPINFVKNKKFIAVTFNYRLGVNGFLCLGTPDAPGNAGLKDQLALLRWVNKNIAAFGGNPDDVTIIGGSAGSVSVELLMLSKTTKGLFHKVIPESGSSVGVIALQIDPLQNAKNIALMYNFTNVDDIYALESFYKSAPLSMFLQNQSVFNANSTFGFTPCIERDTGSEVFLHDAPVNIIKQGKYKKLPMLFGFDNMEGIFQMPNFDTWNERINEIFGDFLPADLEFENEAEKEKVAQEVKEFYFQDNPIDKNTIVGYVDFFTDVQFAYPTLLSTKLHVEAGHEQIYLYEYSFVDANTPRLPGTNLRGASHCEQSFHVLDISKFIDSDDSSTPTEEYEDMKEILQDIWYNFIKYGKPVLEDSELLPAWPPVGSDLTPHMSLGVEVTLRGPLLQQRAKFWENIYSKYYRVPIPPPTPAPTPQPKSEL